MWTRRESHRSVSRAADRDSRRQGQRQPVHAAARAAAQARAPAILIGAAAEKIAVASSASRADRTRRTRSIAPCIWRRNGEAGRHGAARAGVLQLRPVRKLRAARAHFQANRRAARRSSPPAGAQRAPGKRIKNAAKLATGPETVWRTLALCLIGAVMVFSASAVTAREQYGIGYIFLFRQLLWSPSASPGCSG